MKFHRILFLFFFLHSLSVEAQVPSYVDTNGLVGWWPFDGNANDISGNGNNGLVYGSTLTTDRNLNTNSAYSFNGSSYISVANSALLSSLISEGTISLWTVSNFGGGSPICKSGSSLLGDFRIQHSTSNVSFIINGKDYSINGIFPAGQWINIVMTYKNSTAKLYINGNLIGSLATPSNTYTIDRINSLDFGRDPWGSMEYHNGKIDDIGIWNKALDSNKVKLLYNATPCNLTYNFLQDTITSCGQDSVLLNAGAGFASYNWSNGDSTQMTYAKATGMYSVQVTDSNGCSAEDSVFVSIINDSILQNDTTICKGDSVSLSVNLISSSLNFNGCASSSTPYFVNWSLITPISIYTNLIRNDSIYYSRSNNDVFKSNFINGPWISLNFASQIGITSPGDLIDMLELDWAGNLFVSTAHNDLYSFDGTNWNSKGLSGFGSNGAFMKKLRNNRIIVSKWGYLDDLYISDNNGTSWTNVTNENHNHRPFDIEVANNGNIFVANTSGLIVKSTNNGSNWTLDSTLLASPDPHCYGIEKDCDGNLYAIGDNKLYKSIDEGTTWVYLNPVPVWGVNEFEITSNGDFYIFSTFTSFYRSSNQGASWTLVSGLPIYGPGWVRNLKQVDDKLLLITSQGIYAKSITQNNSVFWSIGDTTSSISVSPDSTTTYYVTISNGIHSCVDSVTVTVNNPKVQFAQDTITSCNQDSVLLDAGAGFASYNWSNGDSTQSTFAKATGMYSVQVTDSNGCSAEDSVFVSIINDSILQNDTTICKGDSVLLSISQPIGQALTVCNGNNLPSNLQTGLVGYWPFCGNANDESGNGYGGVVNGAVLSTDRFGLINAAYSFDGIDDNIEVQNYQDTLNALSISLWFNQTISGILLDFGNETLGGSNTFANRFNINDYGSIGNLMFSFDYTYGQIPLTNYSSLGWNHTVVTWNGSTMNLYVNNLLIGTQTSSISEIRIFLSDIKRFGSRYQPLGSNQVNFGGIIDDIGIWNRALNTSEVQQLYLGNYSSSYSWSTGDTTSSISVSPDSTTTYYVTISNGIHSCVDSVTVTVNNPQFQFAQDSIAGCDTVIVNAGSGWSSYSWSSGDTAQSVSFTTTGMKILTVTDSIGCTATDSIYVTVNTYVTTTMADTSCDQYTWSQTGVTYTMTGTYRDTIPTAFGCDSIINLNLVINNLDTVRIPVVSCDSFTWSQTGLTYYTSGVYSDSLVNNQGCDSILLLDLTITQTTSSTISAAACDSFTWLLNGMTYNSSGVYSDTITNSQGCDSIVSLNLTINTLSYQLPQDTITSCNQDSVLLDAGTGFTTYNWSNGDSTQTSYVSATGMYSVQVSDSNGCSASDSVFVSIINDTILQNDTTICKGDSISLSVGIPQPTNLLIDSITIRMDSVWDYYFTSLDTTRNYLLKVNGLWANCCGHLNYDVAFGGITWSSISPVIWNSSAIYFHMDGLPFPRPTPDVYSTSHQYDYPLSPSKDSIEISFYDNPTTDNIGALRFRLFQLIDPSSLTYQWSNGDTASSISVSPDSTTTYYVTISNGIHSCVDSVTVTVNNPQFQFAQDSVSGCDTVIVNAGSGWSSYSWSSGDTNQSVSFTTTGMKVLTVTDSIGCTATDSIYVTVNTYVTTAISDTSCDQYTWSQTGVTYTMTGTYSDTIPTAFGCDSIIVLDLTINVSDTVRIPTIACDSFTWSQTGLTYYTSGVYSDSLVNNQGCDSILFLDLTITQTTSSTISAAACDSFTWLLNGMTYNSSGVYSDTITNSQGCDSIIYLNLTINTLSYQLLQDTITSCGQDSVLLDAGAGFASYNWSNGDSTQMTYAKATGMYAVQVTDSNGCSAEDSVFVSIIKDSKLQNDTTICKGDSVSLSVFQLQPQALTICNSNNLPSNLQTGLVGYWPFCGNANDESGNGNNGTVNGVTLTLDKFGNLNSAYNFSGNAQTIELPNTLIPGGQNNSFTIQTRVKFDNINNSPNLWGKTLFWGEVNFSVSSTGEVTLKWANSITGNKYSVIKSNPGIIQPNIWYDLVVSFQNNQAIIFVNGSAITTNYLWTAQGGTVLSTSRVENSCNFNQDLNSSKFGARITGGTLGNYLDGSLDEFTVWNRTLSNTEISQLYSLYFPGLSSNNFTNSYQWSTGDTTSATSVSPDSTTKYYVTISNGIHSCVDSVTVTVNNPQFQFAQDSVTGCDTVTVNAGAGWSTYTWSSGDTTQSVSFTTTGMKVLTVTDSIGCVATDSIYVTVNTFVTSTITDTSCDQYTWRQTGITYGSSGTYRDTVPTVVGCDSILELVLTITNSTFSSDTVVACESYLWTQTGATYYTTSIYFDTMVNAVGCDSVLALDLTVHYSTSFIINQTACDSFSWAQTGLTYFVSGTYQDTLLNARGCDSVVYLNLLVYPTITPIIGNVQNMCENDPIVSFTASPIGGVWSGPGIGATGSFDPTLAGVGVHTIVYTAAGQCANSDTVTIEVYDVPMVSDLIKDDECDEGIGSIEITVTGGMPPYSYVWSNGKTTKDNLRLKEGTYSLTVTDSNGCIENYIGSLLNLEDDSCDDTYLFVPNIFSPDGNGVNDVLFVDGKNIQQVQLMIYNRWGNLVFQSNSVAEGWDGNFKGKPVNQGVFVYIVTGRFKDGKDFDQKGTITLIRKK